MHHEVSKGALKCAFTQLFAVAFEVKYSAVGGSWCKVSASAFPIHYASHDRVPVGLRV